MSLTRTLGRRPGADLGRGRGWGLAPLLGEGAGSRWGRLRSISKGDQMRSGLGADLGEKVAGTGLNHLYILEAITFSFFALSFE